MLKKALCCSILLFANMILLAHAVIPHHYHDGIPFFDNHHEHSQYPHNEEESIEDCFFSRVHIRLDNDKQVFHSLDFDLFSCFLTLSILKIADNNSLLFEQKPCLLSFYNEYISSSLGLRAPPVC